MIEGSSDTKRSFEAAVRSFTDAEVALGEFVTAAQRFRSASETIERAEGEMELTRTPILEALEVLKDAASELQATSRSLRATTEVLAGLDPSRFWATLADIQTAVQTAEETDTRRQATMQQLIGQARAMSVAAFIGSLAATVGTVLLLVR